LRSLCRLLFIPQTTVFFSLEGDFGRRFGQPFLALSVSVFGYAGLFRPFTEDVDLFPGDRVPPGAGWARDCPPFPHRPREALSSTTIICVIEETVFGRTSLLSTISVPEGSDQREFEKSGFLSRRDDFGSPCTPLFVPLSLPPSMLSFGEEVLGLMSDRQISCAPRVFLRRTSVSPSIGTCELSKGQDPHVDVFSLIRIMDTFPFLCRFSLQGASKDGVDEAFILRTGLAKAGSYPPATFFSSGRNYWNFLPLLQSMVLPPSSNPQRVIFSARTAEEPFRSSSPGFPRAADEISRGTRICRIVTDPRLERFLPSH